MIMAKRTHTDMPELAPIVANATGVQLYRAESSDPVSNAEQNLMGRTHYIDPQTRKAFSSRILSARHASMGLLFYVIESMATGPNTSKRGFRYSVFDVFGTRVVGSDSESFDSSRDKASAAMWAALNTFDVGTHYKTELATRAERMKRDALAMAKAARSIRVKVQA